jgi:hypothetical protein
VRLAAVTAVGWLVVGVLPAAALVHVMVLMRLGSGHRIERLARWASFGILVAVAVTGSLEVRSFMWGGSVILGNPALVFLIGGGAWTVLEVFGKWLSSKGRYSAPREP